MASAAQLRRRGNSFFQQASSDSLSPCLRSHRLQRACSFYSQAHAASCSEEDKAMCCKNLGAAYWKHAKLGFCVVRDESTATQLSSEFYPFLDLSRSVSHFSDALSHGRLAHKSLEWMENIEDSLLQIAKTIVEEASKAAEDTLFTRSAVFQCLVDICNLFSVAKQKGNAGKASAIAHKGQAECLLKTALKLLQNRETASTRVGDCLQHLQRCYSLLQVAEDHCGSFVFDDIKHLRDRVFSCQRICESLQAIKTGDGFVKQASGSTYSSKRRIELALWAVDKYKEAEVSARGFDLEAQAVALSSIAKVYEGCLRIPKQAVSYYRRSLKLLSPDDMKYKEFYAKTAAALQSLQGKGASDRERDDATKKGTLYDELKEALSEIERQFRRLDWKAFLKFVYSAHPPIKRDAVVEEGGATARLAIRKAIVHYHPDHNCCTDEKWKIVAEEITKRLLLKYGSFKEEKAS